MREILELPKREEKPRNSGITHVLDKGAGIRAVEDLIETAGNIIDIVKLGWGTSMVTQNLEEKIKVYRENDIPVCLGGTLLEVFIAQNRIDKYISFLKDLGIRLLEVSNGVLDINRHEKLALIEELAKDFVVISEVGKKEPGAETDITEWVDDVRQELSAGAWKVVAEGRESGTVGLYDDSGTVKEDFVNMISKQIDLKNVIFETPAKNQQIWFLKRFGSNVNLGNIAAADVIALETLRLGLRGDTLRDIHLKNDC